MSAAATIANLFDSSETTLDTIIDAITAATKGDYLRIPRGDDQLSRAVAGLIQKLQDRAGSTLSNVVDISVHMNETAVKSANLLQDLRGVDEESRSIAAAAEKMATTVDEIGQYGSDIVSDARNAADAVTAGREALDNTASRMSLISTAVTDTSDRIDVIQQLAGRISEISDSIKRISAQTNMLAINAAVEAARAGDAGRGFAVVASEVKALSDRTAGAAVEIGRIIQDLQGGMGRMIESMSTSSAAVKSGNTAVEELRQAMTGVEKRIGQVTGNANQIAQALDEQRIASREVAGGISRVAVNSSHAAGSLEHIIDAMDAAQQVLSEQLANLAECNIPHKVVKLAQSDHVLWKKRLAAMMIGREGLDPRDLADHHSCRLGKWYDGVDDPAMRGRSDFAALEDPHAQVHKHGIQAVKLYNAGDVDGALREIGRVEAASLDVLRLLKRLER